MSDAPHAPPPSDGRPALEHPEVAFEPRDANIRIIVATGLILVLVVGAVCLALWGMFYVLDEHQNAVKRVPYPLVRAEANQPPQGPPLEGIQAQDATITVQGADGKERTFAIDRRIPVTRDGQTRGPDHEPLNVFDLGAGAEVTVVYEPPPGQEPTQAAQSPVAQDRAVSVITPPITEEQARALGIHVRAAAGRITRLVAISPLYRHFEAKAQLNRPAGWVQGQENKVAHIPIDKAIDLIAETAGGKAGKEPADDARPGAAPVGGRP